MNRNGETFGAEFLKEIPPVEYGCACGDTAFIDASAAGSDTETVESPTGLRIRAVR